MNITHRLFMILIQMCVLFIVRQGITLNQNKCFQIFDLQFCKITCVNNTGLIWYITHIIHSTFRFSSFVRYDISFNRIKPHFIQTTKLQDQKLDGKNKGFQLTCLSISTSYFYTSNRIIIYCLIRFMKLIKKNNNQYRNQLRH